MTVSSTVHLVNPLSVGVCLTVRQIFAMLILFACCLQGGCHIVDTHREQEGKSLLTPIKPEIETVQLDIIYIERDADDPLLSSLVWDEVDTIGTVNLETRSKLRKAGFRIGLVGLTPPRSLQRLLGLKQDITDLAGTSRHNEMVGRTVHLRSGGEAEILTSNVQPEISIQLPGESEPTTLRNVRCVLRTELERLQDGWIKLHITPEIHHGNPELRPVAGVSRWELKPQQEIISLRDLKFSVTLNVGEMLMVSSESTEQDKIADRFFVNQNDERSQRRMVVIRLTDMKKIKPLYEN